MKTQVIVCFTTFLWVFSFCKGDFTRQYFGKEGRGIANDLEGNIYVVGTTDRSVYNQPFTGSTTNGMVLKLSPNGTVIWCRLYAGTGTASFTGIDVCATNVYVTGSTGGRAFMVLIQYNTNGVFQWSKSLHDSNNNQKNKDEGIAVRCVPGYVFVAGHIFKSPAYATVLTNSFSFPSVNVAIALYTDTGVHNKTVLLTSTVDDNVFGIVVYGNSVYVSGYHASSFEAPSCSNNYHKGYLVKLTFDLQIVWFRQVGTGVFGTFAFNAIAHGQHVYLFGSTFDTLTQQKQTGLDSFVTKFSINGEKIFTKQWISGTNVDRNYPVSGLVYDSTLVLYGAATGGSVTGASLLMVLDMNDNYNVTSYLWGNPNNFLYTGIAVNPHGVFYTSGSAKQQISPGESGELFVSQLFLKKCEPGYLRGSLHRSLINESSVSEFVCPMCQQVGSNYVDDATACNVTSPFVLSLEPQLGPLCGNTNVSLFGYFPRQHEKPIFQYGDTQAQAKSCDWISTSMITCTTPPFPHFANASVYMETNSSLPGYAPPSFSYFSRNYTSLRPNSGPITGGTLVRVQTEFVSIRQPSKVKCKLGQTLQFPATSMSNGFVTCSTPPTLQTGNYSLYLTMNDQQFHLVRGTFVVYHADYYHMTPKSGLILGGTVTTIVGIGFNVGTMIPKISINPTSAFPQLSNGRVLGNSTLVFSTAKFDNVPFDSSGKTNKAALAIALNGVQYLPSDLTFHLYEEHGLSTSVPNSAPILNGNITITLLPDPGKFFTNTGDEIKVKIRTGNYSETIVNGTFASPAAITFITPKIGSAGMGHVSIALNGQQWSGWQELTFFRVDSISPIWAPTTGGTDVTITGAGFTATGLNIKCKFGVNIVTGTFISSNEIRCSSPGLVTGEHTVFATTNGYDYTTGSAIIISVSQMPSLSQVQPASIPAHIQSTITVVGNDFLNTSDIRVRIGTEEGVGQFETVSMISCSAPPLEAGTYSVSISLNGGQQFTLGFEASISYLFPTVSNILPTSGPERGESDITITGSGFLDVGLLRVNISSQVVHGTLVSTTRIVLTTPVMNNTLIHSWDTSDLLVRVSTNGGHTWSSNGVKFRVYRDDAIVVNKTSLGSFVSNVPTNLVLNGEFAVTGSPVRVRMNGTSWTSDDLVAIIDSYSQMRINTPVIPGTTEMPLTLGFQIALNGQQFSSVVGSSNVVAYHQVGLSALNVTQGPVSVQAPVKILGSGFLNTGTIRALFGGNQVDCTFLTSGSIWCQTPSLPVTTANVQVALNGQTFTLSDNKLAYVTALPTVTSLSPDAGPEQGGTLVIISGSNFFTTGNTNTVLVRLAGQPAVAVVPRSNTQIVLSTNSFSSLSFATSTSVVKLNTQVSTNGGQQWSSTTVEFSVYRMGSNTVSSLYPNWAVSTGGTAIELSGSITDTGINPVVRVSDGNGWTRDIAAFFSQGKITFSVPQYSGTLSSPVQCSVMLSLNGQQFVEMTTKVWIYDAPTITNVQPAVKAFGTLETVTVTGSGFNNSGSLVIELGGQQFVPSLVTDSNVLFTSGTNHSRGDYRVLLSMDGRQHFSSSPNGVNFQVAAEIGCPKNTISYNGAALTIDDCFCEAGFYTPTQKPGVECQECPQNADCSGRTSLPAAKPGFFNTGGTQSYQFTRCAVESACPGGTTSNVCAIGYTGRLCGSCVSGYYRLGDTCQPCTDGSSNTLILLIALFVAYLYFVKRQVRKKRSAKGKIVAIAITHLQVISTFSSYRLTWPDSVKGVFNAFSLVNFNLDTASPECTLDGDWTYLHRFWLTLLLPFIALVGLLLRIGVQYLHAIWVQQFGNSLKEQHPDFFAPRQRLVHGVRAVPDRIRFAVATALMDYQAVDASTWRFMINELLFTMGVLYITLCNRVLEVFDCTEIRPGFSVMDKLPDEQCWVSGGMHEQLVGPAYLFLFFYVIGIPVAVLGIMYMGRNSKIRSQPSFAERFSSVFSKYTPAFYWFEGLIMVRKAAIVAVKLFATTLPAMQGLLGLVVLGSASIAQLQSNPYNTQAQNRLEVVLLIESQMLLISGMIFVTGSANTSTESHLWWEGATLFIAGTVIVVCLYYAISMAYAVYERRQLVERYEGKGNKVKVVETLLDRLQPMVQADMMHSITEFAYSQQQKDMERIERILNNATNYQQRQTLKEMEVSAMQKSSSKMFESTYSTSVLAYMLDDDTEKDDRDAMIRFMMGVTHHEGKWRNIMRYLKKKLSTQRERIELKDMSNSSVIHVQKEENTNEKATEETESATVTENTVVVEVKEEEEEEDDKEMDIEVRQKEARTIVEQTQGYSKKRKENQETERIKVRMHLTETLDKKKGTENRKGAESK